MDLSLKTCWPIKNLCFIFFICCFTQLFYCWFCFLLLHQFMSDENIMFSLTSLGFLIWWNLDGCCTYYLFTFITVNILDLVILIFHWFKCIVIILICVMHIIRVLFVQEFQLSSIAYFCMPSASANFHPFIWILTLLLLNLQVLEYITLFQDLLVALGTLHFHS